MFYLIQFHCLHNKNINKSPKINIKEIVMSAPINISDNKLEDSMM